MEYVERRKAESDISAAYQVCFFDSGAENDIPLEMGGLVSVGF